MTDEKLCGKCKHFCLWNRDREISYWENNQYYMMNHICYDYDNQITHFGDCDKIVKGTSYRDGETEFHYDGYSFSDENYDDMFHCFEGSDAE